MRLRIYGPLAAGLLLAATGLLSAQTATPPSQAPTASHGAMMQGMASGGSGTMHHPAMGSLMEQREQRMALRRSMMERMQADDAKLDTLLARMNESEGSAKVDAMAEVVRTLVAERREMRTMMETMPGMAMPGSGGEAMTPMHPAAHAPQSGTLPSEKPASGSQR